MKNKNYILWLFSAYICLHSTFIFALEIVSGYNESFENVAIRGFREGANSSAPWAVSSEQASLGSKSLKSGDINDNQKSILTFTGNFETYGQLGFDLYTDTESCCDYLNVYVDGIQVSYRLLSHQQWQEFSIEVGQGQHVVTWEYYKDGSASTSVDAIYIDNLQFTKKAAPGLHPYSFLFRNQYPYSFSEINYTDKSVINNFHLPSIDCNNNSVVSSEYLPDGRLVYGCSSPDHIGIFNLRTKITDAKYGVGENWGLNSITFRATDTYVYFYDYASDYIKSVRLSDGVSTNLYQSNDVDDISYTTDDSLWVLSNNSNQLFKLDASTGVIRQTIIVNPINNASLTKLSVSNNGLLIVGDNRGLLYLVDYEEGDFLHSTEFSDTNRAITDLELLDNGHFIVSNASTINEYKISNNQLVLVRNYNNSSVYHIITKSQMDDSDNDGLSDLWEEYFDTNPDNAADASLDPDNDGLSNLQESLNFTYPNQADTDGDNLSDGAEVNIYGTSPINIDSDNDGLDDDAEVILYGSDPLLVDSDGDGLTDYDEVFIYLSSPILADTDGDGLDDKWEIDNGTIVFTNDAAMDTDNDGLTNIQEFNNNTFPLVSDSDADLLNDGDEVAATSDPLDQDSDGDGFIDGIENQYAFLDILVADDTSLDQDNDGYTNLEEALTHSDLDDVSSVPPYQESNFKILYHDAPDQFHALIDPISWSITSAVNDYNLSSLITHKNKIHIVTIGNSNTNGFGKVSSYGFNFDMVSEVDQLLIDSTERLKIENGMALTYDGYNVYLKSLDGKFTNTIKSPVSVREAILTQNGDVLSRSNDKLNLMAKTGIIRWSISLPYENINVTRHDSFGIDNKRNIIFVLVKGKIQIYSLLTGEKISTIPFSKSVDNLIEFPLTLSGYTITKAGNLLFSDTNQRLYSVSLTDKNHLFTRPQQNGCCGGQYNVVYSGTDAIVEENYSISKISEVTGETLWEFDASDLEGNSNLILRVTPQFLIITSSGSQQVHFVDINDRTQIQTFSLASLEINNETITNFTVGNIKLVEGKLFISNSNTQLDLPTLSIDLSTDRDNDGLSDAWERLYNYSSNSDDSATDTDGDGLNNLQEFQNDTDPRIADSDNDGLSDGYEVLTSLSNPLLKDTDGDGLTDDDEVNTYLTSPILIDSDGDGLDDDIELFVIGSNPNSTDSDNDGMGDYFEVQYLLAPNDATDIVLDADNDGLNNLAEFNNSTNPLDSDTDDDNLSDGAEVNTYGSNPLLVDTDQDLIIDGDEVNAGLNPNLASDALTDLDNDGYSNRTENYFGSDLTSNSDIPNNAAWSNLNGDYQNTRYRPILTDSNSVSELWNVNVVDGITGSVSNQDNIFIRDNSNAASITTHALNVVTGLIDWSYYSTKQSRNNYQHLLLINDTIQFSGYDTTTQQSNLYALNVNNRENISQQEVSNYYDNFSYFYEVEDSIYWQYGNHFQRYNKASQSASDLEHYHNINDDRIAVIAPYLFFLSDSSSTGNYQLINTETLESHSSTITFQTGGSHNSGNSRVIAANDNKFYFDLGSNVYKHDPETKIDSIIFQDDESEYEIAGRFVIADNLLVFYGKLSDDSYGYKAISMLDGHLLWESDVTVSTQDISQTLAASSNHIFINNTYNDAGVLYLLDISTGALVSTINNVDVFSLNPIGLLIVEDRDANQIRTYTLEADHDNDLIPSYYERKYGLDPFVDDATNDPDEDGLSNLAEYQNGTLPNQGDTDGDNMSDGWEIEYGLNPNDETDAIIDIDGDGLINIEEFNYGTSPVLADTDGDGLWDELEVRFGINPLLFDSDNDGLSDGEELQLGTNIQVDDTDGDGIKDGREVELGLNPLKRDSDGDGILDGDEAIAQQKIRSKWQGWRIRFILPKY
ncbi:hypothetical protein AADZ91_01880 [Colwelliaceae bacterium 6441]